MDEYSFTRVVAALESGSTCDASTSVKHAAPQDPSCASHAGDRHELDHLNDALRRHEMRMALEAFG